MKKNVLFLTGGRSDEHEISLISTRCALDALDRSRFTPLVVGISKEGAWYFEDEKSFYRGEVRADKIQLNVEAPRASLVPYAGTSGQGTLKVDNKDVRFDVVFPILHGRFGEDGTLQGLCEMLSVPYVGSNCGASWICMDKVLTKQLCTHAGIRVGDFVWLTRQEDLEEKASDIRSLGNTLFVKPARTGSSVGISKVSSPAALRSAVETAFQYDNKVLIEKGIAGREIECALLGLCHQAKVALPGEIVPSPKIGWYSYEAKYLLSDGANCVAPAALDRTTSEKIQSFALKVFDTLECDGMARVDLFLENGTNEIFLNEVNTIPGFTPISMYPKMWETSGVPYGALITRLIELAFERHGQK